ncbi:MAG: DUF397 domain-containing protein [Pseudonocardiales bacterium]
MNDLTPAGWQKSIRSSGNAACVELAAFTDGGRAVRDSKNPTGPALRFQPAQWDAFLGALSRGEIG